MASEPFAREWPGSPFGRVLEMSSATESIAAARHAAAVYLAECGCTNIDDAVLVLSELMTNAVLHTGGADRVIVGCDPEAIRIAVHDAEPAVLRQPDAAPPIGGRGLPIVQRLAEQWGSTVVDDGKFVWAILPSAPRRP